MRSVQSGYKVVLRWGARGRGVGKCGFRRGGGVEVAGDDEEMSCLP